MKKRIQLKLKTGGLMRCCVASFEAWAHQKPDAVVEPGDQIECVYERKVTMVVNERGDMAAWIGGKDATDT